jgi:hypothetical protein
MTVCVDSTGATLKSPSAQRGETGSQHRRFSKNKLLPAGRTIAFTNAGICAVTASTTTCEVAGHGFVFDPQGNQTFGNRAELTRPPNSVARQWLPPHGP